MLGENYTDELVVPLSKLGLTANAVPSYPSPAASPPPVVVSPQFIIENRMPLEPDLAIYQLAEQGRVKMAARTLTSPVMPSRED